MVSKSLLTQILKKYFYLIKHHLLSHNKHSSQHRIFQINSERAWRWCQACKVHWGDRKQENQWDSTGGVFYKHHLLITIAISLLSRFLKTMNNAYQWTHQHPHNLGNNHYNWSQLHLSMPIITVPITPPKLGIHSSNRKTIKIRHINSRNNRTTTRLCRS